MTINTGSKENTSKKGGVNLIKQYTVNISFKEQYIFYFLITIQNNIDGLLLEWATLTNFKQTINILLLNVITKVLDKKIN